MLCNINELYDFPVNGSDGAIGHLRDAYFDDQSWTIRFLVVETGAWLGGRKVLIPLPALLRIDGDAKRLTTALTHAQVSASPGLDTHKPVSRQHEVEQLGYYGYPFYWGEGDIGPGDPRPGMSLAGYGSVHLPTAPKAQADYVDAQMELHRARGDDAHLRSCRAIERYHIHATDGDIGHLESMLLDDGAWTIRYLVVNTSDWWLGHQVLVAPPWITDISWLDATVSVDLTRQAIKDAPAYDPRALPNLAQERGLYGHYGRPHPASVGAAPPAG